MADARASAAASIVFPTKDSKSAYWCCVKKCGIEKKDNAWLAHFEKCQTSDTGRCADVLLLGDSITKSPNSPNSPNFAFGGEKIEQCRYRVSRGRLPSTVQLVVLHIGTNNLSRDDQPKLVAGVVVQVCEELMRRMDVDVLVSGILPRRQTRLPTFRG